ncbi:hypothetical protein [Pseudonocardia sp. TRM90224]|uniref:hypothetical protein n=1 Tax=Pseudonocardia sp. TRM90224 TaxID=2812678 RepID=UPI001E5B474C|nr:hypothetical protein [Pseudonocardia sp. TRM90224]
MTAVPFSLARIASTADGGRFLRLALRLDAAGSGALGLGGLVGATALAPLLGTTSTAMMATGGFLVVYALALVVIAGRPAISRPAAWTVVVGNSVWVLASIVTAMGGPLTAIGVAVVLAQAAAVLVFIDMEWLGLRRMAA